MRPHTKFVSTQTTQMISVHISLTTTHNAYGSKSSQNHAHRNRTNFQKMPNVYRHALMPLQQCNLLQQSPEEGCRKRGMECGGSPDTGIKRLPLTNRSALFCLLSPDEVNTLWSKYGYSLYLGSLGSQFLKSISSLLCAQLDVWRKVEMKFRLFIDSV